MHAGHQLPPNTLLGVYHGQFKTLAEDAAYTGEDVTGARGVAASYTFSAPWSYESEGEGLALVGHSNGSLMGLLNDVRQW